MTTVHQTASGTLTAATPAIASFASLPTAVRSVISLFMADNNFSPGAATGVTDNQSNTYVSLAAVEDGVGGNACDAAAYWDDSIGTPSGTFTASAAYTGTMNALNVLIEASGLSAIDRVTTANDGGVVATSKTLTSAGANASATALVVAIISLSGYSTPSGLNVPTGYTDVAFDDTGYAKRVVYKICTGSETSSVAWSWTDLQAYAAILLTFDTSAVAGIVPVLLSQYRQRRA
jgi:hypothetical protein